MQKIESPKNEQIKQIKKLQQKKYRQQQGRYLLEGWHSVKEALNNRPAQIKLLLVEADYLATVLPVAEKVSVDQVIEITPRVTEVLSETVHPEGVFAVIANQAPITTDQAEPRPWLVLDRVQDPGNAGTMVRTADAAGFAGVVFSEGGIDPWNSKVVRSMQGSQFHLQVLQVPDLKTWLLNQRTAGYQLLGTLVDPQATDMRAFQPASGAYALVLGNEAHGMAPELAAEMDVNLYVPIFGHAESLNVAIAAAILMYQLQLN